MFSVSTVSSRRRILNNPIGPLLVILLLALALRLLFFVGIARTDDYNYAQAAYNAANGGYRVAGSAPPLDRSPGTEIAGELGRHLALHTIFLGGLHHNRSRFDCPSAASR